MFRSSLFMLALASPFFLAPSASQAQEEKRAEQRGYLGLFTEDAPEPGPRGAVVRDTVDESPAAKAGLRNGDIIQSVDGKPITGFEGLAAAVKTRQAGDKLELKILRDGKEQKMEVTLAAAPDRPTVPKAPFDLGPKGFRFRVPGGAEEGFQFEGPEGVPGGKRPMIGVQLQPLDESLRERLNLGDAKGVLVADVVPGSPAAKAGIAPTDLIVEAEGKAVADPKSLSQIVAEKKAGDTLALTILRGGKRIEMKLEVAEMALRPGPRQFLPGPDGEGRPRMPMDQFHNFMVPMERINAMQKRIDQLESKVEKLTTELQMLRDKTGTARPAPEKSSPEKKEPEKKAPKKPAAEKKESAKKPAESKSGQ